MVDWGKDLPIDRPPLERARRQISAAEVGQVVAAPGQTECVRKGRRVDQARIERGEPPKAYGLRVVVDIDREPPEVVTAYRSSKVQKYWRSDA